VDHSQPAGFSRLPAAIAGTCRDAGRICAARLHALAAHWVDDERYVAPFLWGLDSEPIDIDDLPPSAFDSPGEKDRVAALLDKYNHADEQDNSNDQDDANDSEDSQQSDQADQADVIRQISRRKTRREIRPDRRG
jgi:hypothetical protein